MSKIKIIFLVAALNFFCGQNILFSQQERIKLALVAEKYNINPLQPIKLLIKISNVSKDTQMVFSPTMNSGSLILNIMYDNVKLGAFDEKFIHTGKIALLPEQKIRYPYDIREQFPYLTKSGKYSVTAVYKIDENTSVNSNTISFYLEAIPENEVNAQEDFFNVLQIQGSSRGVIYLGNKFVKQYPESIFRRPTIRLLATALRDSKQYDEGIKLLVEELNELNYYEGEKDGLYSDLAWCYYKKGNIKTGIEYLKKIEANTYIKNDLILRWTNELRKEKN